MPCCCIPKDASLTLNTTQFIIHHSTLMELTTAQASLACPWMRVIIHAHVYSLALPLSFSASSSSHLHTVAKSSLPSTRLPLLVSLMLSRQATPQQVRHHQVQLALCLLPYLLPCLLPYLLSHCKTGRVQLNLALTTVLTWTVR